MVARHLIVVALEYLIHYPFVTHVSSVVKERNEPAMRLNRAILGEPWGIEPDAGFDTNTGKRCDVAHFKASLDTVVNNLNERMS